jgi:outer membrane receptor protein involved in Fe transport
MKRALLLSIILISSWYSQAQTGTIRGTIIDDATGEPMIGANVIVPGQGMGAISDLDGSFSLVAAPGTYEIQISFITYQTIVFKSLVVEANKVNVLGEIRMKESSMQLAEVVVVEEMTRNSEAAIVTVKKRSPVILDGISAAKIKLVGDGTAVEAAKRVTGVSIEGGKYVYIRGLGDRYTRTTLNGMDIPGLDPDKNSIQLDIFPTNLISNIMVSKNFSAELPADFTGGILNIETTSFPEEKVFEGSFGISYNPDMHFNSNFLDYKGGATDFLGFDDGTRAVPTAALSDNIPTPISGASSEEVNAFVQSFNPTLGADRTTSLMDYSASLTWGNQIVLDPSGEDGTALNSDGKLGYVFSLSYKSSYTFYDDVIYGEYQRTIEPTDYEMNEANIQTGELGERNMLLGGLAGLAYKKNKSKYRLNILHLQSGERRAGLFYIINDESAVGQSGYEAESHNLEYNERSLTNVLVNGQHITPKTDWTIDWRISGTRSVSEDPDIRKTAFTFEAVDTAFNAGAGGNPSRLWRNLMEYNWSNKLDFEKKFTLWGDDKAEFKTGASYTYKNRDYEILFYDIQFFGLQSWDSYDPNDVLKPENIFPNTPNAIYYQSGNPNPNPNAYSSNVHYAAAYASQQFSPGPRLKTIIGLRAEYYVQRHTGRDQRYASGDIQNGNNLDNEKVLESLDLFPALNFIFSATEDQNLRLTYGRTIARPSFKELSFAQILDPLTNRIFNGALFEYSDWDGQLVETRIHNVDARWEYFFEGDEMVSASLFYKDFNDPIELVRIQEQQTSTEYQPRNVGDGMVMGIELELRKRLGFVAPKLENWEVSGNLTLVESRIDMTEREFNSRKAYEKDGETIEPTRNMAGQSPFVVNAGISYSNRESGLNLGMFYNVKGETLYIVGAGLFPDIYYEPFHSLNFSLNKTFGDENQNSIELKVANILDDRVETFYQSFGAEKQPFTSVNPGRSISIGISRKF